MSTSLLKSVAGHLRYRELTSLLGRKVVIQALDTVESDIRSALSDTPVSDGALASPERKYIEGAMAKYGILDLTFVSPSYQLDEDFQDGLGMLKRFGFLPRGKQAEELAKFDDALGGNSTDPTCLRELDEDINQNEVVIRLFLEGRKIGSLGPHILGKLPLDYLPQEFTIKDACMTNAGFIWFHKHFYM
jgi:hypothetical protein